MNGSTNKEAVKSPRKGRVRETAATKNSNGPSVQYELKQVVGRGSYGVVYRAVNKKSRETVAIKEINYESDEELHEVMIEIDLLKNLNHINIVKYHGFIQKASNLYIILEYAAHGSLKGLMSHRMPQRCLEEAETQAYIKQTLHGLVYLHEQGVIHRDIKAANLLLDADNIVKLADFGVSTMVSNTAMTLAGSLNWMAPEIITNRGASPLSDIWSLGATVVELLTSHPPFHNLIDINIYYAIEHDTYYPPQSLPQLCQQFLAKCFKRAMHKRPSAKQLLEHPWLKDVPDMSRAVTPEPKQTTTREERLARFKEEDGELNLDWDADFTQPGGQNVNATPSRDSTLTNYVAKRASNSDIFTSSPVKALQVHNRSPMGSPVRLGKYMSTGDVTNETNNDSDDETRYSGKTALRKIRQGEMQQGKVALIFRDCKTRDIVECILHLLKNPSNTTNDMVISLLQYDTKHNSDKVRLTLTRYGGMCLVVSNVAVVTACFMGEPKVGQPWPQDILFQCGIMNRGNLERFAKESPRTYYELVYRYLSATSNNWWYDWCVANLDVDTLLREVSRDKRAQSVLVKLASMDNSPAGQHREHSYWVLHTLLPGLVTKYPTKLFEGNASTVNVHCLYILLKALTLVLETSQGAIEEPTSSSETLLTPVDSRNSRSNSPVKNEDRHTSPGTLDESISALTLPENCEEWLLRLLQDQILSEIANAHVWKYFTRVCYNAAHLDSGFLTSLYSTPQLFALLEQMLQSYETRESTRKQLNPTLKQWQVLLLELSRGHKPLPSGKETLFFKVQVRLAQEPQLCPLALETTLSVLQNAQGPFYAQRKQLASMLKDSHCLERSFYSVDPEEINVSTFVNRYGRLAAQQPFENFSGSLILQGDFLKRLRLLFHLYRASLLIQLDLLKLVKALFMGCDVTTDPIKPLLTQVNAFLSSNWTRPHPKQVGRDSVLLIQLCSDIQSLSS